MCTKIISPRELRFPISWITTQKFYFASFLSSLDTFIFRRKHYRCGMNARFFAANIYLYKNFKFLSMYLLQNRQISEYQVNIQSQSRVTHYIKCDWVDGFWTFVAQFTGTRFLFKKCSNINLLRLYLLYHKPCISRTNSFCSVNIPNQEGFMLTPCKISVVYDGLFYKRGIQDQRMESAIFKAISKRT